MTRRSAERRDPFQVVPPALRAPAASVVIDLESTPDPIGPEYRSALLLVRRGRRPIAEAIVEVPEGGLDAAAVQSIAAEAAADAEALGGTGPPITALDGTEPRAVSVVVTTCGNPNELVRCVRSILESVGVVPEVVIVDNRPHNGLTARVVADQFADDDRVRLVREPTPGLSRARNRGIAAATNPIVLWTDDDVEVDPWWAFALVGALDRDGVGMATGLVRPLGLRTDAQIWRERRRGFGNGLAARSYSIATPPADQPLFPFTPGRIGTGANMGAWRVVLDSAGGFDDRLGAGTPSAGAEDLDLILRVLEGGATVRYEPAALVAHQHHETWGELRTQARHYGIGLASYLIVVVSRPGRWPELLRKVPGGVRHLRRLRLGPDTEARPDPRDAEMRRAEAAGIVMGLARAIRWIWRRTS